MSSPLATVEKAKCARGRLNLWLQAEPDYRSKKYKLAHRDERLWQFCKRLYPEAALAQVYFATSGHGIDWHRDASFAKPKAYILNLGAVRLETELNDGRQVSLELVGGEVIKFNCKLPHRAIARRDDRTGIAINEARNWL